MNYITDLLQTLNVLIARAEVTGLGYAQASDMAHTLSRELFRKAITREEEDANDDRNN